MEKICLNGNKIIDINILKKTIFKELKELSLTGNNIIREENLSIISKLEYMIEKLSI